VKNQVPSILLLGIYLVTSGCATSRGPTVGLARADRVPPTALRRLRELPAEVREKLMALNPEQVTESEIKNLLSRMPAPRIISINGGLLPIKSSMTSFARFLIGMGYPEESIRNPGDGTYTFGYSDTCDQIAGAVAWYYEREGLRPMIVGHSLGGIQTVRVLHRLAGDPKKDLRVWNPMTGSEEPRCEIVDPLTGAICPVVGLRLPYATAALAGGVGRIIPSEWDMSSKLRKIPDSVEEFTGFQKGLDILGGDYLGYGAANDYYSTGLARVRNVRLPSGGPHSTIPYTETLLKSPDALDWVDNYKPMDGERDGLDTNQDFGSKSARILWVADVWHSLKRHWVLELQRLIRAGF
jgi:hypothetical protein